MGENKNNNVTNNVPNANEAKTNASTVAQYVGKTASNEVVAGVGGFLDGLKYIFVEMPKRLFKGKEVTDADYNVNAADMGEQSLVQKVSERLEDAYNNIPSVKAAREKREAALVPIKIDPKSADAVKNDVKVVYQYLARNKEGKVIKGYFPAFSKVDVYSYLTDLGMIVYEITNNKSVAFLHSGGDSSFKSKMKNKDLVFWLAQLSTYIKAGIPLTDGVKVLAQQDKRAKYKPLYDSLIYELTTGQPFSVALERQGKAFPALLVNMVKSSEMIGNIEDTLEEMSAYYQEVEDTKKAIIGAMAYPTCVFVFAIGICVFMLTYIVPKFVDVYESMDAEINPITQVCLDISAFLQNYYLYLIVGVIVVIAGYIFAFRNIKEFRVTMQRFFMHLPIVGKLIIAKEMSMWARTFASLQKNNVLLTDSIDILEKITSNEIYKELMTRTVRNLIKGNKMSETFKNHWAVPDIASFMIQTGESTGELAQMLDKVADYYQKEQKNIVGSIKTFIEPAMIIMLAVVVGFILVAILVPMFGIYSTVA